MRKKWLTLVTITVCCFSFNAFGSEVRSAYDLRAFCKIALNGGSENMLKAGICLGMIDGLRFLSTPPFTDKFIRVPEKVTNGQLIEIFVRYADEHPKELHRAAAVVVLESWIEAFPPTKR